MRKPKKARRSVAFTKLQTEIINRLAAKRGIGFAGALRLIVDNYKEIPK